MKTKVFEYSTALCQRMRRYYESYSVDLGYPRFAGQFVDAQLENKLGWELYKMSAKYLKRAAGTRVLDIGCGFGGILGIFERNGIQCFGIDTDKQAIDIATSRLEEEGVEASKKICCAKGEALPMRSSLFNMVFSVTVIEHLTDVDGYMDEAFRVLKPGGYIVIIAPNFLSFWEGHYRLYTPPGLMFLSKKAFQLYVRIFGRNPAYADTLNFKITPNNLKNCLKRVGFLKISDIGPERLKRKFGSPAGLVDSGMKEKVGKIRDNFMLRNFGEFAVNLIGAMRLYHPIVMIARKPT